MDRIYSFPMVVSRDCPSVGLGVNPQSSPASGVGLPTLACAGNELVAPNATPAKEQRILRYTGTLRQERAIASFRLPRLELSDRIFVKMSLTY